MGLLGNRATRGPVIGCPPHSLIEDHRGHQLIFAFTFYSLSCRGITTKTVTEKVDPFDFDIGINGFITGYIFLHDIKRPIPISLALLQQ